MSKRNRTIFHGARRTRSARPGLPLLGPPPKQGLYDPAFERDACGVGSVVDIKGRKSHAILAQAIEVLRNLDHRGASGCEVNTGDGAGGVALGRPGGEAGRSVAPGRAVGVARGA